jgi:hypothetical protein
MAEDGGSDTLVPSYAGHRTRVAQTVDKSFRNLPLLSEQKPIFYHEKSRTDNGQSTAALKTIFRTNSIFRKRRK